MRNPQPAPRRTCRRCSATLPATDEHWNRAARGLATVCRDCDKRGRPRIPAPEPVPEGTPDARACTTCGLWYAPEGMVQARCRTCHQEVRSELHGRRRERARQYQHAPKTRFRDCKRSARNRSIPWALTLGAFVAFDGAPCAYCGVVPDSIGLDRVDSSRGYEPDNVVACCPTCNTMKGALSPAAFLEHVRRIARRAA